ncbi:MAG: metalloregulator ArsR/SmtB family transcription factor [Candidatus Rokubacteria bacterium]|nr:metalloregulator ArsR/SmtB family transcription factor [Candidatus Rokubacteria bacterium]
MSVRTLARTDLERTARLFQALADETRLRIIECLRDREECVCHLTDTLETGQSRLSFHLKILKDAGIITDRRQGRWIYYSLNPAVIEELERALRSLRETLRRTA